VAYELAAQHAKFERVPRFRDGIAAALAIVVETNYPMPGQILPTSRTRRMHMPKNKFSSQFESIALSDLDLVVGGAEGDGEVDSGPVKVKIKYKSDPPAAPDPDTRLRCYKQFADEAHWYDSTDKTFHHQLRACGPLPQ
jgi:hypothetical protein